MRFKIRLAIAVIVVLGVLVWVQQPAEAPLDQSGLIGMFVCNPDGSYVGRITEHAFKQNTGGYIVELLGEPGTRKFVPHHAVTFACSLKGK